MAKRKTHSTSFKSKAALEAIKGELTAAELAAKCQIRPDMLTKWIKRAMDGTADKFCWEAARLAVACTKRGSRSFTPMRISQRV